MSATAEDFESELVALFRLAEQHQRGSIDIRAGDLHRRTGDYPGTDHRMPLCCLVMRKHMRPGDRVVAEPPRGAGASLTIRYVLPRTPAAS